MHCVSGITFIRYAQSTDRKFRYFKSLINQSIIFIMIYLRTTTTTGRGGGGGGDG
jgi:hypothetical protein